MPTDIDVLGNILILKMYLTKTTIRNWIYSLKKKRKINKLTSEKLVSKSVFRKIKINK